MGATAHARKPDTAVSTILRLLVDSTLAFGLTQLRIHRAEKPSHLIILDLEGVHHKKLRIENFIRSMWEAGYIIDVRVNPRGRSISHSFLCSHAPVWKSEDATLLLSQLLTKSDIKIVQDAPFASNGTTITINPHIIRGWITSSMPPAVSIRAIDFPEIQTKKRTSFRTIALVTCTLPPESVDDVFKVLDLFKRQFGIDIALNPVPPQIPLRAKLADLSPALARNRLLTRENISEFTYLLKTALRWRTHRSLKKARDKHRMWFSIDQKHILFREDLICFFKVRRTLGVRVAIPDITTSLDSGGGFHATRKQRSPGAFYLGKQTPAWIFEFKVERGALIPLRSPYRDIVTNKNEYEPEDMQLLSNKLYQKMKRNLCCRSDYEVVQTLMHSVEFHAGNFIHQKQLGFLVHHDDDTRRNLLSQMLQKEGFTIGPKTLASKHKIFKLIKQLQKKRAFHVLPLVAAQLGDDSVVCRSQYKRCGLKPQRGTREQINQYILSAAVDGRSDALPEFIKELLMQPTRIIDARAALRVYEEERTVAGLLGLIIRVLSDLSAYRTATVKHLSKGEVLIVVQGMRHLAILEAGQHFVAGQKILVAPQAFDLQREKFIFALR